MEDPHQKSKDEAINIALIHHHINNNTPSGVKIREAFQSAFPSEQMFNSTVESGATRSTHYDLKLKFSDNPDDLKTVEFKGSKHFKPIDSSKHPWVNGVQFYNGTGSKFSIGQKYARDFYDTMLDEIIENLPVLTPKPSYDVWAKDAFKQGKPSTPFVCEIREKGYKGEYLSDCRKKFNKNFTASDIDLITLMEEVQSIANEALGCKDYWLQIHGNIDDPEAFHVKWSAKVPMPEIQEVEQVISKSNCDINFKLICADGTKFSAKLRWGYGQCISNIRVDIK
jgi:hypothetical protein